MQFAATDCNSQGQSAERGQGPCDGVRPGCLGHSLWVGLAPCRQISAQGVDQWDPIGHPGASVAVRFRHHKRRQHDCPVGLFNADVGLLYVRHDR